MSVRHLLDHTGTVWRIQRSLGALNAEVRTYVQVGQVPLGVRRRRAPQGNPGPGLTPTGTRVLYFEAGVDVRARDVVQLTAGPDAPERLEVDDLSSPRGHHIEAEGRLWAGVLPGDGGAS
jgi:hypothetical protein